MGGNLGQKTLTTFGEGLESTKKTLQEIKNESYKKLWERYRNLNCKRVKKETYRNRTGILHENHDADNHGIGQRRLAEDEDKPEL